MGEIFLGVVADDFTGASDAASFLVAAGVPTVLFGGVPQGQVTLRPETAAIVIALKTRTEPAEQAVAESLQAFEWLREMGAQKLYLKYCSTFDSTESGNIGPVTDAVMDRYGFTRTVLCPALPVNGRTVRDGILYVNGIPLAESTMKDHPLTPMRKSRIAELMEPQGKYIFMELTVEELQTGGWEQQLEQTPCYLIPDYYREEHGDLIAEAFEELEFLTGGSGLAGALGRRYVRQKRVDARNAAAEETGDAERTAVQTEVHNIAAGRAVLLAGSCSAMTLAQIADYQSRGGAALRIEPQALWERKQTAETLWDQLSGMKSGNCLVYSSAAPEDIKKSQQLSGGQIAALIENTLSELAVKAFAAGYRRFIVAGGETSGAVTKALGFESFYIGASVAPGVPVMTPLAEPTVRLVLKSGNFGQPDFFTRALEMTE